jgi:hypothetical protein
MPMKRAAAVALMLSLLAPGCRRGVAPAPGGQAEAPAPTGNELRHAAQSLASGPAEDKGKAADAGVADPGAALFAARKLVRTAHLALEVARYADGARALARLAEANGGYVADSQAVSGEENQGRGTVTIRVPADRFAAILEGVHALGRLERESVSTQDVTKAYTDLESRLRMKRETSDRLRALLKDRTASLSDVLQAERELARVTEEIEQMEGERRYYDQQVALSTIAVEMHEPAATVRPGALDPIKEALRDALGVLASSVAVMVYLGVGGLPWVVLAVVIWRVARAIRRRRAKA